MYLPNPPSEKEFENAPAGAYLGRCYKFIDLGTQPKTFNNVTTLKHMVGLSWELPTEFTKEGKPFVIYQSYSWSMHPESNLRKMLENWRGQKFKDEDFGEGGFDTKKLIGQPCTISIVHDVGKDGKTYANIASVSKPIKNAEIPPAVNEPVYFSFSEFNGEILNKLSNKMRDAIMRTPEYAKIKGFHNEESNTNDEPEPLPDEAFAIPF